MIGDDEIAAAVAYVSRHCVNGLAPSVQWYEATCGTAGVRSLTYMRRHYGLRYSDLVLKAGAEPRGMARIMASRRERPNRTVGVPDEVEDQVETVGVPDEVEDQVEQEAAHRGGWQDAHGRTWLNGGSAGWFSPTLPACLPRREEIGRHCQPDGTVVVTYRYYYPLK